MRTIEFKAKGYKTDHWYYGLLAQINPSTCIIKTDDGFGKICDTNTICEYTGLKDAEDVRIYENDILEVADSDYEYLVEYDPVHARYILSTNYGAIFDIDNVNVANCTVV